MNVLVLNTGSGSQKGSLFCFSSLHEAEGNPLDPVWEAKIDSTAPDQPTGKFIVKVNRQNELLDAAVLDKGMSAEKQTQQMLQTLWEGPGKGIEDPDEVDLIAHRVVHGGREFDRAVFIDPQVEAAIDRLSELAPLHNPRNLAGIRVTQKLFPGKPQTAVFDTAFHRTLPEAVATYGGPREWIERGIRRYGFHGTSFRYVSERAAEILNRSGDPDLRLVLCHLGGGCSLCATVGGQSLDTTMGFTPLDGLVMCTRSGSLDPSIPLWLLRHGTHIDDLEEILTKQSGLKGLSGLNGDTRVLGPASREGNPDARLALEVFIHRLRSGIGQMIASLGHAPHAIVFTDVIGEDEPFIREAACQPFHFLGVRLDAQKNAQSPMDAVLSNEASTIQVLLIQSREEWQMAKESFALLKHPFSKPCIPP